VCHLNILSPRVPGGGQKIRNTGEQGGKSDRPGREITSTSLGHSQTGKWVSPECSTNGLKTARATGGKDQEVETSAGESIRPGNKGTTKPKDCGRPREGGKRSFFCLQNPTRGVVA